MLAVRGRAGPAGRRRLTQIMFSVDAPGAWRLLASRAASISYVRSSSLAKSSSIESIHDADLNHSLIAAQGTAGRSRRAGAGQQRG